MNAATQTHLSIADLAKVAPAALAKRASRRVSQQYTFIPTTTMIAALESAGFVCVSAKSQRAYKGGDNDQYGKHVLRFRLKGSTLKKAVGETIPEVLLIGSHNGRTRFTLRAGAYRLVCSNGMTVASHTFGQVSCRHSHGNLPDIVKAALGVIKDAEAASKTIEAMRNFTLDQEQATAFAAKALLIRFRERKGETSPIPAEAVLTVRRPADEGLDLWHVFNRVQENLTKGGMEGTAASGRKVTVRAFDSATRDAQVNFDLWQLALATMGKKAPALKSALVQGNTKVEAAAPVTVEVKPAKKVAAKKAAKPVADAGPVQLPEMAALGL